MIINKKLISIIVPTRERYNHLYNLLVSLETNTVNHSLVEIILIADYDDPLTFVTSSYIKSMKIETYLIFRPRESNIDKFSLPIQYYQKGLNLSSSSYFKWILGDDCMINTKDWDNRLIDLLNDQTINTKNNIDSNMKYYYITVADSTHWTTQGKTQLATHNDACCFPILSSNYIDDMGEFFPVELPGWGADFVLYDVVDNWPTFEKIDMHKTIEIIHHTPHNDTKKEDPIAKRMKDICANKNYSSSMYNSKIELLKKINLYRNSIRFDKKNI